MLTNKTGAEINQTNLKLSNQNPNVGTKLIKTYTIVHFLSLS